MEKMKPKPKLRGARYPWEKWLMNLPLLLIQDRDFAGSAYGFTVSVRAAARRLGVELGIRVEGKQVTILPGKHAGRKALWTRREVS